MNNNCASNNNQGLIGSRTQQHDSSSSSTCYFCNGFYEPSFGEPICGTCHDFVYDGGLGLDFSSLHFPIPNPRRPTDDGSSPPNQVDLDQRDGPPPTKLLKLSGNIGSLTTTTTTTCTTNTNQLDHFHELLLKLPSEMRLTIFELLDDTSILMVSKVTTKFKSLIQSYYPDTHWEYYIKTGWPLLRPQPIGHVQNYWYNLASNLMDSLCCRPCYFKMHCESHKLVLVESEIRHQRLATEIVKLAVYPVEGIEAIPLDSLNYSWLARIDGPPDSPYQDGIFYLHLTICPEYPWNPPTVRFLTKIHHPNVSRHGDIGIDTITFSDWTASSTIGSVLVGIRSLLTDPATTICMEPAIASLYSTDRVAYEGIARDWTRKYAMIEILPY